MTDLIQQLRGEAKKLLTEKRVEMVIGYGTGTEFTRVTPVFVASPDGVDALTWGPFCVNNLVKYLVEYRHRPGRVAVVAKGCDARAVNRLISDNQIDREQVFVIGLPCPGILDGRRVAGVVDPGASLLEADIAGEDFVLKTDRGEYRLNRKEYLLRKCCSCENPNPVIADMFLGEELPVPNPSDRFAEVQALEQLTTDERSAYWDRQFSRCLRCYACRNVCPACTCRQCVFDQVEPNWVSKRNNLSENTAFHLIRAFHVAGRCVDCGECDRVCPVAIPLRKLNRKILKDIGELFDAPTPGSREGLESPLGGFSTGDPEEFM